jgi:hypothetical protein
MQWRTFLRAHWRALLAADFFTTQVWTVRGLVTYYTVFVIELHTRRVHVLGSTPYPDELFVIQTMRHLTDPVEGILRAHSVLICDRDRKWSVAVQHFLKSARVSRADTVPCAELQCLRGAACPRDQGEMSEPCDPAR